MAPEYSLQCSQEPTTGPYPDKSSLYPQALFLSILILSSYVHLGEPGATGWTIGVRGFDTRRGLGIFLVSTASRPALRAIQPPVHCVPGAKRPEHKADHSPPSSAEVKNA